MNTKRVLVAAAVLLLGFANINFAQSSNTDNGATAPANQMTSFVILRTGVMTSAPHVGTYHYAEFFQARGNWIYPDVGYIDFAQNDYREVFAGGGRTLVSNKRATLIEELYYDQAMGPASHGARYLQPWTLFDFNFTSKLIAEVVYFPYLPINRSARIQHVLEHAKMEWTINKWLKAGGGLGGYKYGDDHYQSKPLVTSTIFTRVGAFEFWLQKMPGGAQVQLRYQLAWQHKR